MEEYATLETRKQWTGLLVPDDHNSKKTIMVYTNPSKESLQGTSPFKDIASRNLGFGPRKLSTSAGMLVSTSV